MTKIKVSINGAIVPKIVEVDPSDFVGSLVKKVVPALAGNADVVEDVELYPKNEDVDLDKGIRFDDILKDEKGRPHLYVGRCKVVMLTVEYAGKTFEHKFPSATSLDRVKAKALEHFGIGPRDGADLFFWIGDEPIHNPEDVLVGSLTDYPVCSATLRLASKKDINGFSTEEELFNRHLDSDAYKLFENDEKWSVIKEGSKWPFFLFSINSSVGGPVILRFDLHGYNLQAPSATCWDLKNNAVLASDQWPNHTPRCKQIFRPTWNTMALYLPCDRIALAGHSKWPDKYSYEIWKPGDTIVKYLFEVYDALNRGGQNEDRA